MNEIGIHGDGGRRTVTSTAALARAVIHETAVFCRPSPSLRDARIA